MDDRTRTHEGTEAPYLPGNQYNSLDYLGLLFGGLMAVLLGVFIVAGLSVAIGTWPAVIIAVATFAGLVWKLIPTVESTPTRRARTVRRLVHRGIVVASLGGITGICMSALPGCSKSPVDIAAHNALHTNNEALTPMTLRGIDDAVSDGDISPELAEQYRGLIDDNTALIDSLRGEDTGEDVVELLPLNSSP